jgi:hypothetical protein
MGMDFKSFGAGEWLRLLIGALYVGIGIGILYNPRLLSFLQGGYKTGFAVLLISYGVFRIYRTLSLPRD